MIGVVGGFGTVVLRIGTTVGSNLCRLLALAALWRSAGERTAVGGRS